MIKKFFIQILLLTSVLLMTLLLSSCNNIDTTDADDYESFLQEMNERDKSIYDQLPQLSADQIEDIYLYYSDDFLDSFYAIYLKCSYTEEQYDLEYTRIEQLTEQWSDMIEINSESFTLDSLCVDSYLEFNDLKYWFNMKVGLVDYSYFLFDDANYEIIYVLIFEKELNGKSTNIPSEYLPKELNELRSK